MSELSDDVRRAIQGGHLAHLVTLNSDGSPQVSLVWAGVEGDEVVTAHLGAWQKVRNVQRDPRVVFSMETGGTTPHGLAHYLVVHGRARVSEGGAPQVLQRLAETYVGPGVKFPPMDDPPPGYVLRITVDRVGGVGPWAASP